MDKYMSIVPALLQSHTVQASHAYYPLPRIVRVGQDSDTRTSPICSDIEGHLNRLARQISSPSPHLSTLFALTSTLHEITLPHTSSQTLIIPPLLLPTYLHLTLEKSKLLILLLSNDKGNYFSTPLHHSLKDLYRISIIMDKRDGKWDRLNACVTVAQDAFSKSLNDRTSLDSVEIGPSGSKKVLVLPLVLLLFRCYFTLNTLRLCRNLARPVLSKGLDNEVNLGGKGTAVGFKYYLGRLNMFSDEFLEAEQNLTWAYTNCPPGANRKRILSFLVPVRLLRGRLPMKELLVREDLWDKFGGIVEGIRTGDMRNWELNMNQQQMNFIKKGTYLLLHRTRPLVFRTLFIRLATLLKKTQIPLPLAAKCLKALHIDIDLDELECVLANLIFKGIVRGYISHEKRVLVLSKKEAFPRSALELGKL
ncbi:hypothetical protein TrST_g13585 [Triparma strigata]|uniref:PCI domain-containing protein n=1 Tax=Triparma strigata TaxID=1606541 RepID=A0A9W7A5X7_9STRA|nr:hypothetical protein TrST_g13585 [Triparma strigata]